MANINTFPISKIIVNKGQKNTTAGGLKCGQCSYDFLAQIRGRFCDHSVSLG